VASPSLPILLDNGQNRAVFRFKETDGTTGRVLLFESDRAVDGATVPATRNGYDD
jgi:hypothetical protein